MTVSSYLESHYQLFMITRMCLQSLALTGNQWWTKSMFCNNNAGDCSERVAMHHIAPPLTISVNVVGWHQRYASLTSFDRQEISWKTTSTETRPSGKLAWFRGISTSYRCFVHLNLLFFNFQLGLSEGDRHWGWLMIEMPLTVSDAKSHGSIMAQSWRPLTNS